MNLFHHKDTKEIRAQKGGKHTLGALFFLLYIQEMVIKICQLFAFEYSLVPDNNL